MRNNLPSNSRLHSSHSQNSVLYSEPQDDYDFQQPPENIIFNQSFYKEKQLVANDNQDKREQFLSLEFVKKYFDTHSIEPIVSKAIKAVLDSDYLPENPFNTLYRLLTPDALLMNAFHYYKIGKGPSKRINANVKSLQSQPKLQKQPNSIEPWMQEILTKRVIIAEKEFFVGLKMVKYINPNALYYLWGEIFSKQRISTVNELVKKHSMVSCYMSLGGPAILTLEGSSTQNQNSEFIKLSLKANEPISLSSYTDAMLELGYYVMVAEDQPALILSNFCNFVIDDALQEMQQNPNEVYMFLTKLSVEFGEKQAVVEWSTQQLVQQRAKIVKQLVKLLITNPCNLTTHYYLKSSKKLTNFLFEDHFTVAKTYILISPSSTSITPFKPNTTPKSTSTLSIFTNSPLSFMFEHCFVIPHYYQALDKAYALNSIENDKIFLEYRREKFRKVVQQLKIHQLTNAGRELFFLTLYDMSLTSISAQTINDALSLALSHPLAFLSKIIHQLKTCKIILNPTASSLTTNSEAFLYQTLQGIETQGYEMEKESDMPYGQVYVGLECIRKILAVLLTRQRFRVNVIKLLLDYAILSLRGVLNSYLTIAWSSTGTLHEYLISLDKSLVTQTSTATLESIIIYEHYLSNVKLLPERALNLGEEVKRYKQELGTTEGETRDLILTKYLQRYRLYELVYGLNWQLVEGKKLNYPLSKITEAVRAKALQTEMGLMQQEILRLKKLNQSNPNTRSKISVNRINGIQIYEMSSGVNNQFAFYAYSKESLNSTSLVEYRKFQSKFIPYFQPPQHNPTLPFRYLISLKNLPFINEFSEESSGIFISTLYADLVVRRPLKKQDMVTLMYNQLTQFMQQVDRDEVGVVGVYAAWRNLGNASIVYHGDSDEVHAQAAFDSTTLIRFDYKRKTPFEQFYKFLQHCITAGKQIQVRLIYKDQKVIQSTNVIFNVYFPQGDTTSLRNVGGKGEEGLKPLIEIGGWEDRVFSASRDIVEWGVMNGVAGKKAESAKGGESQRDAKGNNGTGKEISPTKSKPTSSKILSNSAQKILLEQQVLIQQLILQQQLPTSKTPPPNASTLRLLSPSYTHLQQSHHHLLTLLYLLTYIKHDRRNRFQLPLILDQVSLVEYYLMERCLKSDRFCVLQGLAVEVANLLSAVRQYLAKREDNLGMEWEVVWVEKVVCRVTGLVKMLMVSVTAQIRKYAMVRQVPREL